MELLVGLLLLYILVNRQPAPQPTTSGGSASYRNPGGWSIALPGFAASGGPAGFNVLFPGASNVPDPVIPDASNVAIPPPTTLEDAVGGQLLTDPTLNNVFSDSTADATAPLLPIPGMTFGDLGG